MKFIYRQLCAVFNGDLSYLPSQNIPDRTRFFDKPFLLVAVAIGSILMLPEMGTAQITFFSSGTNMRTAGNYTVGGLPTSSTDVLITTPSTQINISGGTLSAQSFNIINATSYILGDSTASAGTLAIGRTSFTNAFSGGMDEFLLANNSNLTIQPKVSTGTASLGVTLGGTANFNIGSGSTLTISSIITDLGLGYKIIKTGTGTLALSGVNTYTGIVIDTGIVSSVNGNTNFGTYPGAPVSNYITINGGIIQANGAGFSFNVNRGISLGTSGGTLDNNGFAIADAAVISGVGSLTKIGTGTLTVSIAATYTGNTNIQKDTLKAGLANALSASTVLNLGQTPTTSLGIFDLNANSQTIAGLNSVAGSNASALSNSVVNSSTGTPVLTLAGAGSYTFGTGTTSNSGVISTGVGITMSGSGLQVLGSINTYTGPTKINAGELRYALPAGSSQTLGIDTLNGGTLGTTGCGASSSLTFSTLALVNNSTISLGAAVHTVTFTTASFTAGKALTITGWTGAIANSGTAGKVFIGSTASLTTTQLSQIQFIVGAITYKATQLSTGEIVPISAETDLFQNSDMQVATNYTNGALPTNSNDLLITTPVTTPDISNGNITAQSLNVKNGTAYTIGDTSTTARVLTLGNAISFSNVISGVTNDVVSLSGNSSLTIKPTVGVTLSLALASSGNFDIATGSTLTDSAAITGTNSITKTGAGVLVLLAANTYSGNNTFSAGELRYSLPAGTTQSIGAATFNSGTLSTIGSGASSTLTFSSIVITNNSIINLDSTVVQTIKFTAAGAFTAGKILTINGWKGTFHGGAGTEGKIFIGTSASLTPAQLTHIQFVSGATTYNAIQLSTGEIVPFLFSQETDLFQNSDMQVATNYTNGALPTNTNDLLITTPVTTPNISNGNVTAQSLNVKNGTAYTITDTSVTPRILTLGNTTAFTNIISGVANDVLSLSGNSSLIVQPKIGGTTALSIALASSGNFDIATGSTFTDDSATITGTNSITKTGGGTLVLLGLNTYSGKTVINGGVIAGNNGNSNFGTYPGAPVSNQITINGATIQAFAVPAAAPFSFNANRGIVLGASGGTFDDNGFAMTDAAVISGTGSFTKIGTGVFNFTVASTYTGSTNIQQDTGRVGIANGIATTSVVNLGSASTTLGTLDLRFSQTIAGLNSVTGTNVSAVKNSVTNLGGTAATLTISGSGSYSFGNNTTTNSGVIVGGNKIGLTMSGTGLQVLGGVNAYTGTTKFAAGELRFTMPAGTTQTLGIATFAGGKLSTTGSGASSILSFTTINVNSSNDTLALETSVANTVKFTTATTVTSELTITGWQGTIGTLASPLAGTEGRVFVGASKILTALQLSQIQFLIGGTNYAATQLGTGEVVPINAAIATGVISPTTICAGTSGITIPFTYTPTASFAGATFTAQLSDVSGSFASPVILQSVATNSTGSQSISVTIPIATVAGTGYLIRVVSNIPAVTGTASSSVLTITGNTWVGGASGHTTDWNTATNWCSGVVPTVNTNAVIPGSLSFYPNITATSYVDSITISSGASVTVASGGTLSIHGSITNSGTFDATAGAIEMAGASAQSIGGSTFVSSTINNLIDSNTNASGLTINTADPVSITGQLSFGYTTATLNTNNALVLVSNATTTASIGQIAEVSGVAQATINGNVTIQRFYQAHRRWRLVTAPVQASSAPTISAAWQEGGQSIAGSVSNPNAPFGTHISGPTVGA
ncbi:MAG TPA: autotransporter-associated beta strand repeat-containing protein, partial [Ferruginibacter sp.]|nr:autotransporter-associated beta strand repeat-containing protein [Ferruginibacter sp.]